MTDAKKAIAESIIDHVNNDDLQKLERIFSNVDDAEMWRDVLVHELNMTELLKTLLSNDIRLPRLAVFDIVTMSAWHYAAMRGADSIVELFLVKSRLPVDAVLETGTTALHLACFAGETETAATLIDKHRADINRKDKYGWTPLHYSTLGGQLPIVELLVSRGADVQARDKDGTTAAFRAQTHGLDDIVSFLLVASEDASQLLVDDSWTSSVPIYAKVSRADSAKSSTAEQVENEYEIAVPLGAVASELPETRTLKEGVVTKRSLSSDSTARSEQSDSSRRHSEASPIFGTTRQRSRCAERREAEFEYNTITNVLREEFLKFRQAKLKNQWAQKRTNEAKLTETLQSTTNACSDYEEIGLYSTLTNIKDPNGMQKSQISPLRGDATQPWHTPPASTSSSVQKIARLMSTSPPPLPPRHPPTVDYGRPSTANPITDKERMLDILRKIQHDSYVMESAFQALAAKLETADDWKKLAHSLPLRRHHSMVETKICQVEKSYPRDVRRQAIEMLRQWRSHRSEAATVPALMVALRNCGLGNLVTAVQAAAQQSKA